MVKRFFIVLCIPVVSLESVSLTGPFSAESQMLLKKMHNPAVTSPALRALRLINSIDEFHADFKELNRPTISTVFNEAVPTPILEAAIQIIVKNRPELAHSFLNPYIVGPEMYRLLLAKLALLCNNQQLLETLIMQGDGILRKNAFFMTLYEAQEDDLLTAEKFLTLLNTAYITNNTDQIGYTPLAVAAVNRASPALTRIMLALKADVNTTMPYLFPGEAHSFQGRRQHPYQETQTMTVLELVDNALHHETRPEKKRDLQTIKKMLDDAGAKPSTIKRIEDFDFL